MKPLRILAVDISHLFRMSWEADKGKLDADPSSRVVNNIASLRAEYDRVVICCDGGRSFRCAIDPAYKANRTDPGETYRGQLRRTIEQLGKDGCIVIHAPLYGTVAPNEMPTFAEADDVIGSLYRAYYEHVSKLAEEAQSGWFMTVLSDDGDFEQLVDDAWCSVQKSKLLGGDIFTESKVLEKRGVPPSKIADVKALGGDKSDNYKPFPGIIDPATGERGNGIGETGATTLVKAFGGALAVFDDLDRIGPNGKPIIPAHVRKLLDIGGIAAAERGLSLARIRSDIPIDFSLVLAEPVAAPIEAPEAERSEQTWPASGERIGPEKTAPVASAVPEPAQVSEALTVAPPQSEPAQERKPAPLAIVRSAPVGLDPSGADWALSFQPETPKEAFHMSVQFHKSGLFQKKFASPEAIWTVIMIGREHGLSVMASLQSMHLIDGKVELAAELIVAKILRSGLARYFSLVSSDDKGATWTTHRVGEKEPLTMSFTIDEAERREIFRVDNAGRRLTQYGKTSMYQKMPDVMCMWRAATKLGRAKYSEVCLGLYGEGELRERPADESEAA